MKRQALAILALLLLLGGANSAATQTKLKVLRLEYVVVRESRDDQGRVVRETLKRTRLIASDGRQRAEFQDPRLGLDVAEIFDHSRNSGIQLDLKRKTAKLISPLDRKLTDQPSFTGPQNQPPRKTRLVQGIECEELAGFQGQAASSPPGAHLELAFCRDPSTGVTFPGSTSLQLPDGKLWREDLVSVVRDFPVDPQIFEVPSDFRVVDQ